jgi:predicted nucleotidyltransferase
MEELKKDTIIKYLKQRKDDFFKNYSIEKIGLFGSFANNNDTSKSDIDIVYETSTKDLTFIQFFQIEEELKKQFNRNIDLVNFKYMNPLVKRKALKDMIYV